MSSKLWKWRRQCRVNAIIKGSGSWESTPEKGTTKQDLCGVIKLNDKTFGAKIKLVAESGVIIDRKKFFFLDIGKTYKNTN